MNVVSQSPVIRVLWTGGLDSSYRMVQLSRRPVRVQPYYLSDNRRSEQQELNSIAEVTKDIQNHPDTVCTILPLLTRRADDIEPDKETTRAYRRLRDATGIGSQYDWLARFAKSIAGLELCLEKAESSKALNCILKFGALKLEHDISNEPYYVIDTDRSNQDLIQVFGPFRYPIIDKTKLEMVEEFKRLGFEQTMHKTWFLLHTDRRETLWGVHSVQVGDRGGAEIQIHGSDAPTVRESGRGHRLAERTVRAVLSRLADSRSNRGHLERRARRKRAKQKGG